MLTSYNSYRSNSRNETGQWSWTGSIHFANIANESIGVNKRRSPMLLLVTILDDRLVLRFTTSAYAKMAICRRNPTHAAWLPLMH